MLQCILKGNAVTASPDFIAAAAVWQTPTISREPYMMLMISDVRWREKSRVCDYDKSCFGGHRGREPAGLKRRGVRYEEKQRDRRTSWDDSDDSTLGLYSEFRMGRIPQWGYEKYQTWPGSGRRGQYHLSDEGEEPVG